MTTTSVPNVTLNNGVTIPQVGYGIWQVPNERTEELVRHAFDVGYRHIDGAAAYGNERELGGAIAHGGLRRDEMFITTKLWNADQGYDSTIRAFDVSMEQAGAGAARSVPDPLARAGPREVHGDLAGIRKALR